MRTSDFFFDLPDDLIAQRPATDRDASRLLHLDRSTGVIGHHVFRELPGLLRPGDRLVFNDTRVLPARVFCRTPSGGAVELLFVDPVDATTWIVMARPGKRLAAGTRITVDGKPEVSLVTREILGDGRRVVSLGEGTAYGSIEAMLHDCGVVPLPPYINRAADSSDTDRYQTVYACQPGAVAAPTAGLHFTENILEVLKNKGVSCSFVTLHVGVGTFKPVSDPDPRNHQMHKERYILPAATVEDIRQTRNAGGRILAVGTTVVRVLESCTGSDGTLAAGPGATDIYILPGYAFRAVDGIITNFHLPQSTLLMLMSAFAGREPVMAAYREAVLHRYRFFSYGDAMLVL